jgi:hypothetical protein
MGDRIDLSTRRLAKAIRRLRAAAEERRRHPRGSTAYEAAAALEKRLTDEVAELAELTVAKLADHERATRAPNDRPVVRRSGD